MSELPGKTIYFRNLDALRFISFLGVFFSHTLKFPTENNVLADFFLYLVSLNYFSVPLFFTLSSFLITYHLLSQQMRYGKISLLQFYRNRILRIWPIYFLLVATCFLLIPALASVMHIKSLSLPQAAPFLFFYANFYIIEHGNAFTAALLILWSISIEEQFYLTWGPLLKFLSKKWLPGLILLLLLISLAFSYHYLLIMHKKPGNLAIHSIYVLQNFCTGALMAWICINKNKSFLLLLRSPKISWAAVYIILPVSCFFLKDIVLLNLIKSCCYSLIIFDQAFNEQRIFNAGKIKLVNYLGKISYGLYIYHALVIVLAQNLFKFFSDSELPFWISILQAAVTFMITAVIAHTSYRYIELKFLALKKRF